MSRSLEGTGVINVEQRDRLSIFHMRHGKANALDTEFCQALTARLEEHRCSATQALVLTGHGQIFSAGVDSCGSWTEVPATSPGSSLPYALSSRRFSVFRSR